MLTDDLINAKTFLQVMHTHLNVFIMCMHINIIVYLIFLTVIITAYNPLMLFVAGGTGGEPPIKQDHLAPLRPLGLGNETIEPCQPIVMGKQ